MVPNDPTLRRVQFMSAFLIFLCGILAVVITLWIREDCEKRIKAAREASAQVADRGAVKGKSVRWSRSPGNKIAVMTSGDVNAIYFYDDGEQVGCLSWEDLAGNGRPVLRWTGTSVDGSARVFLDFLQQSGRLCDCPQNAGERGMRSKD